MAKKWYGNVTNRIEEGRNYNKDKQIHVGDDITKYHWSDRTCYYVTEVIDQKHIKVKRYYVCADHSKESMTNSWKYFKSRKEMNNYLKQFFHDHECSDVDNYCEEEWVYKWGSWRSVTKYTKDDLVSTNMFGVPLIDYFFSDSEISKLKNNKIVYRYKKLQPISFGVKDYYYDYSF